MCGEKQCYRTKEPKCDKNPVRKRSSVNPEAGKVKGLFKIEPTESIHDPEAFRNACELIRKYIPKHGIYLAEFEHVLTGISLKQIEKIEKMKE